MGINPGSDQGWKKVGHKARRGRKKGGPVLHTGHHIKRTKSKIERKKLIDLKRRTDKLIEELHRREETP